MIPALAAEPTAWQRLLQTWIVANLIALVALVQPYVYWAWKRYFRKGRIDIHETAKVEVGYSGLGPTIALLGTLRAVHEDQFVRSIELLLTRTRDNMQKRFEWLALRPATVVIGGPARTELEIASGFMLLTSEPWKYHIIFVDPRFQADVMAVVERVRNAWGPFLIANGGAVPGADLNVLFQRFRVTPDHVAGFTDLDRMLDWQPVEYVLAMHINTANPNHTFSRTVRFSVTAQDIAILRQNCFGIIEESCGRPLTSSYNFRYCNYLNPN
jgi:hypothetical protein